jgi:hypothetical protein
VQYVDDVAREKQQQQALTYEYYTKKFRSGRCVGWSHFLDTLDVDFSKQKAHRASA